jgi:diacylglycerol O-acyltransferase / wax synthase
MNFGFTGCHASVPHMQRVAVYTGEALDELEAVFMRPVKAVVAKAVAKKAVAKKAVAKKAVAKEVVAKKAAPRKPVTVKRTAAKG